MIEIDHHSSSVIVHNPGRNCFLFGVYDTGYPVTAWHNHANLIGGNAIAGDVSPREILRREINEEFSIPVGQNLAYQPKAIIQVVRNVILSKMMPYKDFFAVDPPVRVKKEPVQVITSIFSSEVPDDLIDIVRRADARRFMCEGNLCAVGLDELRSEKVGLAWCAPVILGNFLEVDMPNPWNARAEELKNPIRTRLTHYHKEFNYKRKSD